MFKFALILLESIFRHAAAAKSELPGPIVHKNHSARQVSLLIALFYSESHRANTDSLLIPGRGDRKDQTVVSLLYERELGLIYVLTSHIYYSMAYVYVSLNSKSYENPQECGLKRWRTRTSRVRYSHMERKSKLVVVHAFVNAISSFRFVLRLRFRLFSCWSGFNELLYWKRNLVNGSMVERNTCVDLKGLRSLNQNTRHESTAFRKVLRILTCGVALRWGPKEWTIWSTLTTSECCHLKIRIFRTLSVLFKSSRNWIMIEKVDNSVGVILALWNRVNHAVLPPNERAVSGASTIQIFFISSLSCSSVLAPDGSSNNLRYR